MNPLRSKNVELGKTTFHYVECGEPSGAPLIFLHAFPLSHEMWLPQIELITDYRVLALDIRGFGGSKLGIGPVTLDQYAMDLVEFMNRLEISKAIWVGLSMGGYIALRAKELYPARVSALVLADTRVEADSIEAKKKRILGIEKIKNGGLAEFTEGFLKGALAPGTFVEKPELVTHLREIILKNNPEALCAALAAMKDRTDTSAVLTNNWVPTLFLVGEEDSLTPVTAAERMKQLCKNSALKVIKKGGHLSNLENPADFYEAVNSFIHHALD